MDSKSLTDSACGRNATGAALISREREMSPTSMVDGPSKIHGSEDTVSCGSKGRFLLLDTRNKAKRSSVSQNVGPEDLHLQPAEFYGYGEGPSSFTRQSASSDTEESYDPYKVHAIMDNLKQMLNDDVVEEVPVKKITKTFKKNPKMQAARSVSGKSFSGTAVSAQIAEEGGHVIITPSVATTKSKLSTAIVKKEETPSESSSATTSSLPRLSTTSASGESSTKRSFFSRIFRKKP
jgi:hypothetical protein